jgi:hypothetical protein
MLLLTEFYMDYEALFNCFLQEKNINLLILHQNRELWKKYLCCLESNNKYEHLMLKTLNHGWKKIWQEK